MSLKIVPLETWYGFLFAFHSNYGPILYRIRDKTTFSYLLHSTPRLGGTCRNTPVMFGTEKPEWCGYSKVTSLRMRLDFRHNTGM